MASEMGNTVLEPSTLTVPDRLDPVVVVAAGLASPWGEAGALLAVWLPPPQAVTPKTKIAAEARDATRVLRKNILLSLEPYAQILRKEYKALL
jgi:hypothetical protein